MSARYDRFMVAVDIGTNRKLRRLPLAQRWAFVSGVLALAARSPMRGALLITDGEPVTAEDIRDEAGIPLKDAKATLASLRRLGMLDQDAHGVEWVHDWDDFNPDPKPSDSPEARRERKRRQREKERAEKSPGHADVTRDVTPLSRDVTPGREVKRRTEERLSLPQDASGRETGEEGNPSEDEILAVWAETLAGYLQRSVDGLTTDERCKPASAVEVLRLLRKARPSWDIAWTVAVDTRGTVQAQDRAPNIVALYRQKLAKALSEESVPSGVDEAAAS